MTARLSVWPQSCLTNKRAAHAAQRVRCSFVAAQRARAAASFIVAVPLLASCHTSHHDREHGDLPYALPYATADQLFFSNLRQLCDATFTGQVVSNQVVDADWIGQALTVGPVACTFGEIRMPLAVGADASRTWVLSESQTCPDYGDILFKHEHVEVDGTPSAVTNYGGCSQANSIDSLSFPADEATKANFMANGIPQSNTNVWTLTLDPEAQTLTYALARPATHTDPARDFRAEFDLSSRFPG